MVGAVGYVPAVYRTPAGLERRLATKDEVLAGAVQEWEALLHEPAQRWKHPTVHERRDALVDLLGYSLRGCRPCSAASGSHLPRAELLPG